MVRAPHQVVAASGFDYGVDTESAAVSRHVPPSDGHTGRANDDAYSQLLIRLKEGLQQLEIKKGA